jgi:DNA-binding NarL/FixJ family response regulator
LATQDASVRAIIAARQPIARAGLRGLLADLSDVTVVAVTTAPADASRAAAELRPDLVLLAWEGEEVEVVVALTETLADTGAALIVVVGEPPPPSAVLAFLRAGGRGVLPGDVASEDLGAAIRAVARGLLVLPPALTRALATPSAAAVLDEFGQSGQPESPLTEREREVLQLLALGLPNKTIARRLNVSEHTVKFHVGSILAKLNADSRTEAVTRAARLGLVTL